MPEHVVRGDLRAGRLVALELEMWGGRRHATVAGLEDGPSLAWDETGHLRTRDVGAVLEHAVRRIVKHLRGHGTLEPAEYRRARYRARRGSPEGLGHL